MRLIFVSISLGVLAGCATVSVVPGETTVETSLSQSQSALRLASDAYCDLLAEKGWTEADRGVLGFASTLLRGRSTESQAVYADLIGADTRAPALVLGRISADSEMARTGLEAVTREARDTLAGVSAKGSGRGDVMSYERALVRAQMAHRSFSEALDAVSGRADLDIAPVTQELSRFADTIDDARRLADRLADRYANVGEAAS
jgi:hypothetical protein